MAARLAGPEHLAEIAAMSDADALERRYDCADAAAAPA
jgi:hypothetical protein